MSGVYIPGMEMPDRCFSCPMCDTDCCGISRGSYIEYRETDVDVAMDGRPDWCPLVPVPPHGRLIDKDALEQDISGSVVFSGRERNAELIGANKIINRLHHAPTIIPADFARDTNVPTKTAEEGEG